MVACNLWPIVWSLCLGTAAVAAPAQRPDTILHHGHIFTGDSITPWVDAISIRGDTVLATGSETAILATADKHTQVIDLQGRMAMPGIMRMSTWGGASYGWRP